MILKIKMMNNIFKKTKKTAKISMILAIAFILGFSDLIIFLSPFALNFRVNEVMALNDINNWNFNGNATGWTAANGSGTNGCGLVTSTARTNFATFAYDGTNGNPSGSWRAVSATGNGARYKGQVNQQLTMPGSGALKVKGRFDYFGSATTWRASNADGFIRLDLYDSANTTFVSGLGCYQLPGSNVPWTTLNFGSDVSVTGGTTYTVRTTIAYRNSGTNAATLRVDNIIVNTAPADLSISAPIGTSDASLAWTASAPGSGADGLHATTPYKVYRDTASPASTFLADSGTNAYSDTATIGNTAYYYAVSDMDTGSIESPLSNEVNILTRPGSPGTPTFTGITDTNIGVNWTAPLGGASSYSVERAPDLAGSPGSWSVVAPSMASSPWSDNTVSCDTTYWYKISGANATGDGAYSGNSSQKTATCPIAVPDAAGFANNSEGLPDGGRSGQQITVTGTDFGIGPSDETGNAVKIGIYVVPNVNVISWNSTTIVFTIPQGAATYGGSGADGLIIRAGGSDDVTPLPFYIYPNITSPTPASGQIGDNITISGNHFGASGTITINSKTATVGTWSETSLLNVKIPGQEGAINVDGKIQITRSDAKTSNQYPAGNFTILAPSVSASNPAAATTGQILTIEFTGQGIDTDPGTAPTLKLTKGQPSNCSASATCIIGTAYSKVADHQKASASFDLSGA
ncbi:MAG: IPT/TIG domain-containing protein, partial [Minisyncoccia bacterium]